MPINTFEEFHDFFENNLNTEDWVFRGQSSRDWKLTSTFDRLIGQSHTPTNLEKNAHTRRLKEHLGRFKKFTLGRRGVNPADLTVRQYWALGQHYGLATNYLDWTFSPYVALFFAFQSPQTITNQRVVWAANKTLIYRRVAARYGDIQKDIKFLEVNMHENARLLVQRGIFSNIDGGGALDEIVRDRDPGGVCMVKLAIDEGQRIRILKGLDKMSINSLTLFPDLIGAAEYSNSKL